ncbi:bacterio-opsin activator domain-containing protein [Natrinema sp. H-ect1]|uniref:helix-turn-helix domain-containing protein n=1 Tax=Natrinema sp. H-ect1 TaxID=3242700 RepID=UPI00359EABF5
MNDTRNRDRTPRVREIEFEITAPAYPFVRASAELECRVELAEMIPRGNGCYAEFFTVAEAKPSRVADLADDHESADVRSLHEHESGALLEFLVAEDCPAVELAELGALPRTVRGSDGDGRIVAEVPPRDDAGGITDAFLERVPEATFIAKRETDALTTPFSRTAFRQELRARLTDRQREVLEAAFEAGYYDWPRECSGEDVAAELGIASPTFSQHIHAAERKLLAMAFEDRADDEAN